MKELAEIYDLFADEVGMFPLTDDVHLVESLNTTDMTELLHSSQATYDNEIANLVESKVMSSIPFDYAEVRKSYHRMVQQSESQGYNHQQILAEYDLPFPF